MFLQIVSEVFKKRLFLFFQLFADGDKAGIFGFARKA
jgi:hypothetical protein